MHIDPKTVEKLAHLARLELDDNQAKTMLNDMNRMLDFVAKLDELDVEGVEPLIYLSDDTNVLREDVVKADFSHEEALLNAPKRDSDFFRVPKVINQNPS